MTVITLAGFPPPRSTLKVDGRTAVVAQYSANADGVVGELVACLTESQALALDAALPSGAPATPLRPDMPLVSVEATGKAGHRTWKAPLPLTGAGGEFMQIVGGIARLARPRAAIRLTLVTQPSGAVVRLENPGTRSVTVDLDPGQLVVTAGAGGGTPLTGTALASGTSFAVPAGGYVDLLRVAVAGGDAHARYRGPLTLRGTALGGEFSANLVSRQRGAP